MVFKSVPGILKRRSFIILLLCMCFLVMPGLAGLSGGAFAGIIKMGGIQAAPVAGVVTCMFCCYLCLLQTYLAARFFGWMPAGNLECTVV